MNEPNGPLPVHLVLVADDEPDISRLLKLRLQRRGFEVITADDGDAALAAIEESRPDLIFMDVSMPGRSGIEVLSLVRERDLDAGVIMMTASSSDQPAVEALRGGADDYLRKPFQTSEFEVVLERTTRRVELSRRNVWLQTELDEKRQRLEDEMARAAGVQADLLPEQPVGLQGFEIAGLCRPAHDVGGDFYDWIVDGDRLTFLLADVMGKGMSAALLMATVRAALRAGTAHGTPAEAVRQAARALEPDLIRSGRFVTFVIGELDLTTGAFAYVDAGHGYGYVLSADGVQHLEARGLPFGVLERETYVEGTAKLAPGDTLVIFSDGVVEADAERGEDPFLRKLQGLDAHEAVERLTTVPFGLRVLEDDVTAIALRRHPRPDSA